jgi:hypothetical protein
MSLWVIGKPAPLIIDCETLLRGTSFGYEHIYDEGLPAAQLQIYLVKMIDDFIDLLDESIERNEPFWLLGL